MWTHQDLIDALTSGDPDRTGPALGRLGAHPRELAAVDDRIRRYYRWDAHTVPALARVEAEVRRGAGDPAEAALAALHPNGWVREAALRRIIALDLPELTPWLVLRTADWVDPVRELARTALTRRLDRAPTTYGPAAAPMALLLAARGRGRYARRQLTGALADPAPPARRGDADLLALLLASPAASVRLFALREGGRRLAPRELLDLALHGADPQLRACAADLVARAAVWTGQAELLQRLARSRQGVVRATALTGLARIGRLDAVAAHLDDPDSLVRAQARDAARRTGGDPLGHYRARVEELARQSLPQADGGSDGAGEATAEPAGGRRLSTRSDATRPSRIGLPSAEPSPVGQTSAEPSPTGPESARVAARTAGRDVPVIDGLAETGGRGDIALLVRLLGHPADAVRARALRGLRQLGDGTAPVAAVVPLLRDRSPRVVRAAADLLRPVAADLPDGLARSLLADPVRPDIRRAGYRLLHEPDPAARLAVLLRTAAHPDARLAARAGADAVELIRRGGRGYRHSLTVRLRPDPGTDLLALAGAVADRIGDAQVEQLRRTLAEAR